VGETRYNTAVLIGRDGEVVGTYRKVYPYWSEHGVTPGGEVKVFETDFGRIAILVCFDINFPSLWDRADELGAEIVFWPSAYSGGMPFQAYAMLHNYFIVTSTQNGHTMFVDVTGEVLSETRGEAFAMRRLDLDRTLFHENFNSAKVRKLLREREGDVTMRHFRDEQWYLLEASRAGVSVRELAKEYGLETLRDYRWRSRRQIDAIRERGQALE
jgi:predicted amidohydrolase